VTNPRTEVRYTAGYNHSGSNQWEVLEYVTHREARVSGGHEVIEEGPYVVLVTTEDWTAQAIAALLNADGARQNPQVHEPLPLTDNPLADALRNAALGNYKSLEDQVREHWAVRENRKGGEL
jgi:hypothetical protein